MNSLVNFFTKCSPRKKKTVFTVFNIDNVEGDMLHVTYNIFGVNPCANNFQSDLIILLNDHILFYQKARFPYMAMNTIVQDTFKTNYCKTLIIRVTLFSRDHLPWYNHGTLFSRFFMAGSMILSFKIISEDFIFACMCSREFTRKIKSSRIKSVLQYSLTNSPKCNFYSKEAFMLMFTTFLLVIYNGKYM